MTAIDHNKLLSILFFIKGGLLTLGALLAAIVYGLMGAIFGVAMVSAGKGEEKLIGAGVGAFFVFFAIALGLFILAIGGLYLMAGWKLHKLQPSAKIWVTIASCLSLLSFPLGTALGAYALWFFYGDVGKTLYEGGNQAGYNQAPPPPPHNWQ